MSWINCNLFDLSIAATETKQLQIKSFPNYTRSMQNRKLN